MFQGIQILFSLNGIQFRYMFFMGGIHDQLESHVFELASHTNGGAQMRGNVWLLFVTLLVDLV